MKGILSIAKTKHILKTDLVPKTKIWTIVGAGKAYDDCGEFGFKGCLNVGKHSQRINNLSVEGKAFVKGLNEVVIGPNVLFVLKSGQVNRLNVQNYA